MNESILELICKLKDCLDTAEKLQPGIAKPTPDFGSFTDPRDGREYRTVKIGRQTWLAENLAFDYKGSKCYENNPANAEKYGLLYDMETAKKAVPPGWHLPTNAEWQALIDYADSFSPPENPDCKRDSKTAGKRLKAESGWNNGGNGTDDFGFSALPGGYGNSGGNFYDAGYDGYWWSASENEDFSGSAYYRIMCCNLEYAYWYDVNKSYLLSVRCVQDCGGENP